MNQTASVTEELTGKDAAARSATYRLFARLFSEAPTRAFLQDLVGHGVLSGAQDAKWPDHTEAISVEYAQLFAVPGEQAVQPYESVYCDTLTIDTSTTCSAYFAPEPPAAGLAGFLYGPSAIAVRQAYHRAGFELDSASHELPDHLAIELEFVGRLLERGALDDAKAFFTAHLGRWVFRCLEDVRERAQLMGFYRVVTDGLVTFLQGEL
jgi:TorA maturation chaperone TorD